MGESYLGLQYNNRNTALDTDGLYHHHMKLQWEKRVQNMVR